jgi:DNA-binding MarR family transcriptional regulator
MGRPTAEGLAEELRHLVSTLVRRARAETGAGDTLPYPLRSLLRRLESDGPRTTADLARAEQITPQTAGAFVARLEDEGLVARRADPHDGRRFSVSLTAAGRKAILATRASRESWIAQRIEERLDADERRALAAVLPLIRKIAEG